MKNQYQHILNTKNRSELRSICKKLNLAGYSKLNSRKLKALILKCKVDSNFKKVLEIKSPFISRQTRILIISSLLIGFSFGCYFYYIANENTNIPLNGPFNKKFKPVQELGESLKEIQNTTMKNENKITVKTNNLEDIKGNGSAAIEINLMQLNTSNKTIKKNEITKVSEGGKGIIINESLDSKLKSDSITKGRIIVSGNNFNNIGGKNVKAMVIVPLADESEIHVEGNNIQGVKNGAKSIQIINTKNKK